jgi:gamma-glutamyltranspeptidase / glutathione hydrolase
MDLKLMQMLIFSKKKFVILILCFFSTFSFSQEKTAVNGMVVSANSLASKAGLEVLRRGGNAVDAAVAVGFALTVTYPVAGNIGGGGFMVIHTEEGKDITIDYREKAPLKAHRDMFLDPSGNYIDESSTQGINAAGVPGSVAGLLYALEKYGTMSIAEVIQPAINLAEDGFPLDAHTANSFRNANWLFAKYPFSLKVFTKDNISYVEGDIFKQPDLAATLKRIAVNGRDGFYQGITAEMLLKQVNSLGGIMTQEDLSNYRPVERKPVTGYYRGLKIVSMAPPSSGGIALLQLLNIIENKIFLPEHWSTGSYIHFLCETMKYVYADRSKYLGDPDYFGVPVQPLISKSYARDIFNTISDHSVPADSITPGTYFSESTETTHYSVYDSKGNAVSTTTTLNSGYGNGIVVEGAGFLLNNEMDDFSVKAGLPNQFGLLGSEANSISPGKRMLSSMTPTIVLKEGRPYLIVGSPGGSTIITVVLQVILNVIDFKMDLESAINLPRIHHQWYPDRVDYESFYNDAQEELIRRGQIIGEKRRLGLVEGILIDHENKIIYGASDIRGNGSAEGY